jgi:hypothetical protein
MDLQLNDKVVLPDSGNPYGTRICEAGSHFARLRGSCMIPNPTKYEEQLGAHQSHGLKVLNPLYSRTRQ